MTVVEEEEKKKKRRKNIQMEITRMSILYGRKKKKKQWDFR